jgi:hypothetical protein
VALYEYAADVVPASGAPFRALLQPPQIAIDFWPPNVGDVVRVHADVKRQEAKFDTDDPAISAKARGAAIDADFQSTLAQSPSAQPAASIKDRAAAVAERMAQLKDMKERGVITDAEYQAECRTMISSL